MASQRLGIFGGTFNPIHWGHLNSVKTVTETMSLDKMYVMPAYLSPGRSRTEGPTPIQRLEMVQAAFSDGNGSVADGLQDKVIVDDFEIRNEGLSYTIRTLRHFQETKIGSDLFLVIGTDQFEYFDHWKDFEAILDIASLVVTSRPGSALPTELDEFPEGLADLVIEFSNNEAMLASGKKITFLQLDDVDISSTEIRKRMRKQEHAEDLIPPAVEEYIKKYHLYEGLEHRIGNFDELTRYCADLMFERKGLGVAGYNVGELSQPSEFVLIGSGTSTRHTTALAESVMRGVKKKFGVFPQSVEGLKEGRWVVLDFGALIVHVFYDFTRQEYRLEDLWQEGENLALKDPFVKPVTAATDAPAVDSTPGD